MYTLYEIIDDSVVLHSGPKDEIMLLWNDIKSGKFNLTDENLITGNFSLVKVTTLEEVKVTMKNKIISVKEVK